MIRLTSFVTVQMVGFKEQENALSDVRGVTDDIVREGVRGVPVIVHCCGDRERSEEDGILLLKLGIYDGTLDTFPVIVCPEKPSAEQTTEVGQRFGSFLTILGCVFPP